MILIDSWIWFGCQSMASMGYCIHDSKSYRIFLSAYLHRGSCYSCSIIFAMACCGAPSSTPLAQYARSLRTQLEGEKLPMLFPMYTVPSGTLLEMTMIEPHETLKARDVLVEFQRNMGNAAMRHLFHTSGLPAATLTLSASRWGSCRMLWRKWWATWRAYL